MQNRLPHERPPTTGNAFAICRQAGRQSGAKMVGWWPTNWHLFTPFEKRGYLQGLADVFDAYSEGVHEPLT